MKNKYEVRGEVTAIIINSPKYGRIEALISTKELHRVKEFPNSWCVSFNKCTQAFYVTGNPPPPTIGKRKAVLLHRLITDAPNNMQVDHIDHDSLNNTDVNLRITANYENQQNKNRARKDSKSGVLGVSWHKKAQKYVSQIKINNKVMYLGLFSTVEEAEVAVKEARKQHMPFSQEALAN